MLYVGASISVAQWKVHYPPKVGTRVRFPAGILPVMVCDSFAGAA